MSQASLIFHSDIINVWMQILHSGGERHLRYGKMSLMFTIYEKEVLMSCTATGPYESALVKYVSYENTHKTCHIFA